MTKLKLTIELDYDADLMHQDDPDAIEWFFEDVLKEELWLHSSMIGDLIGNIKVLKIHKEENSDTKH